MYNAAVTAASLGFAAVLAGSILLLIIGTQILNWYWVVLLGIAGLAIGAYRVRTHIPTNYDIAREIDYRLGLHDSLSTAYFFGRRGERGLASPEFVEHQRRFAEELARTADVARGLPFRRPRTLYVNAALAVLACGMFGLRYGIERRLDLAPPLVRIGFNGFAGSREVAEAIKGPQPSAQDPRSDPNATDVSDPRANESSAARNPASKNLSDPDGASSENEADSNSKGKGPRNDQGDDASGSADKDPGSEKAGGDKNGSSQSQDGNSESGEQAKNGKNSGSSGNGGDNSSLADKLRDAFSNLMSKLKPQPRNSDAQQQGASQSAGAQSGPRQSKPQEGSPQASNQEQAEANSGADSQGEQQQGGTQQPAQGKSQGNSNERPNSPDGKNGIGSQEGDKNAREAAELAAMGKINEIIGKRAANLKGEVMVEVGSGKQQLKTQYSQTQATHVEAGGEINRDEVPLAYQQYVQKYFEEIRKTAPSK